MITRLNSLGAATLLAAVLMTPTLAGCAKEPRPAPLSRDLPAGELIVPAPAPRPAITVGMDARLLARRALDYGDANARLLTAARSSYEALRITLNEGPRQ